MKAVFRGFVFAGYFLDQKAKPLPAHGDAVPPLLRELNSDFVYVWHLEEDLKFERLACRILPERIRIAGAQIIDQPRSWQDMLTPNFGNPVWHTRFKFGDHSYSIENQYDMRRAEEFARTRSHSDRSPDPRIDDYVLRLT